MQIINELEELVSCGFGDQLERIKSNLGKNIQTALLSRAISHKSFVTCRKLLVGRIFRVASDENLLERSTCINQNIHVVVSEEKKLQKVGISYIAVDNFVHCFLHFQLFGWIYYILFVN